MSATCWHMSPQCQHCWLKIGWCQMLPTLWLNSWLGHVSADMSPHDCPAISMTRVAITPTDIMVIFKKNMVRIHEIMYTLPYSWLLHTKSYRYRMSFCKVLLFFFMSKRFSRHVSKILDDVLSTCCLEGRDDIFFPMLGRHSQHFANMTTCVGTTCHLGGVGDVTRCRHFQLRNLYWFIPRPRGCTEKMSKNFSSLILMKLCDHVGIWFIRVCFKFGLKIPSGSA